MNRKDSLVKIANAVGPIEVAITESDVSRIARSGLRGDDARIAIRDVVRMKLEAEFMTGV